VPKRLPGQRTKLPTVILRCWCGLRTSIQGFILSSGGCQIGCLSWNARVSSFLQTRIPIRSSRRLVIRFSQDSGDCTVLTDPDAGPKQEEGATMSPASSGCHWEEMDYYIQTLWH
jgi:hypothetical protein